MYLIELRASNGIPLNYKKESNLQSYGWNLEIIILSKVSETEKDIDQMIMYMWNLKYKR